MGCRQHSLEDPVCVVDLGAVLRLFRTWAGAMPRVTPYYAVKCNNDPALLSMLAALGAGFDCASDCEVCPRSVCCSRSLHDSVSLWLAGSVHINLLPRVSDTTNKRLVLPVDVRRALA